MTLLAEIQSVLERTYGRTGLDLEACLIGPARSGQLRAALPAPQQSLCGWAHTFLRLHHNNLYIALYYDPSLVARLEAEHPRDSLSHRNIAPLIAFLEEITHAVHAALAFHAGFRQIDSPAFACRLETLARIDTYHLLLRFIRLLVGTVTAEHRRWIQGQIFIPPDPALPAPLQKRYRLANRIAARFIEAGARLDPAARVRALRRFRRLSLWQQARQPLPPAG